VIDPALIIVGVTSVPATLAAIAGIIAARRSGTINGQLSKLRKDIAELQRRDMTDDVAELKRHEKERDENGG
jgi:hypothetical protein